MTTECAETCAVAIRVVVSAAAGMHDSSLRLVLDRSATGDVLRARVAAQLSIPQAEVKLKLGDLELRDDATLELVLGERRSEGGACNAAREELLLNLVRCPQENALEGPGRSGDASTCAVCFEELEAVGGAVPLPCACKIDYCSSCWDRALNAKYEQSRRAQCPSCRSSMRVDFDADAGRLVFKRLEPGSTAKTDPDMRNRLYEQARPLQITLLRRYGARLQACAESAANEAVPNCVCGGRLLQKDMRERVFAYLARRCGVTPNVAEADPRIQRVAEGYFSGSVRMPITCDVCEKQPTVSERVWTCEAGATTLLHGLAYDVCESCFQLHVHGVGDDAGDHDMDISSVSAMDAEETSNDAILEAD